MILGHEKVPFLHLPTPLEYLPTMSEKLGINLYIKRDDLTGLGMGGNKLRKLEYLLYDAQQKGYTMLLTMGGAQTNHGRLTAAVAAKYGLRCAIICVDEYPGEVSANILLDRMMGADVILRKDDGSASESEQYRRLSALVRQKYEAEGEKIYEIPIGGSNELGILGYYECAMELTEQVRALEAAGTLRARDGKAENVRVITTAGSLGTYMGLFCGLKNEGSPLQLTGVAISPSAAEGGPRCLRYFDRVKTFYGTGAHGLNAPALANVTENDFHIETDYTWGAYNNPVPEVRQAMYDMAGSEAIILDPCYTGKTFCAIRTMISEGKIQSGDTIVFLHTGGSPGINTPFHRREMERELEGGVTVL